eukprot:2697857-Amphidinium_carterae.1
MRIFCVILWVWAMRAVASLVPMWRGLWASWWRVNETGFRSSSGMDSLCSRMKHLEEAKVVPHPKSKAKVAVPALPGLPL